MTEWSQLEIDWVNSCICDENGFHSILPIVLTYRRRIMYINYIGQESKYTYLIGNLMVLLKWGSSYGMCGSPYSTLLIMFLMVNLLVQLVEVLADLIELMWTTLKNYPDLWFDTITIELNSLIMWSL